MRLCPQSVGALTRPDSSIDAMHARVCPKSSGRICLLVPPVHLLFEARSHNNRLEGASKDMWRKAKQATTRGALDTVVDTIKLKTKAKEAVPPWLLDLREILRGASATRLDGGPLQRSESTGRFDRHRFAYDFQVSAGSGTSAESAAAAKEWLREQSRTSPECATCYPTLRTGEWVGFMCTERKVAHGSSSGLLAYELVIGLQPLHCAIPDDTMLAEAATAYRAPYEFRGAVLPDLSFELVCVRRRGLRLQGHLAQCGFVEEVEAGSYAVWKARNQMAPDCS